MSQINSVSKKSGMPRFLIFMCVAIALAALPMILDLTSTTTHAHGDLRPTFVAALTGDPIGEATPRGFAAYYVATSGTPEPARKLTVSVSNVNLPSGTVLEVSLNNTAIGTMTLNDYRRGTLNLSTANGGTVPTVVEGDTVTVGAAPTLGGTTYLSGTFAAPPSPSPTSTHTPWPSPSHTPWPSPSHTPWPSPSGTPLPPRSFGARMNGASVVPPVTTEGMGLAFARLNSEETQLRVCLGYRTLSSDVTAITINGPAATTENGPVIFTLTLPAAGTSYTAQTFDVTADQIAQLRGRMWYFLVSTANNPEGEIRGQLNPITRSGHHGGGGGGGMSADDAGVTQGEGRSYVPVPFDFDDDGISDIAVFQGNWLVTRSSDGKTVSYESE